MIGKSDISTHVNFDLVKKISKKFNLISSGPTNQRNFRIKLGILLRVEILMRNANSNIGKNLYIL